VDVADSARKHDVRDEDIEHAVRRPLRVVPGEGRDLVIGADRCGRLLEVVILDDDPNEEPVVIHAMGASTHVPSLPEVISMPRTREQLQKALTDTEAWLERLDPKALASPDSDGSDLYAIGEALRAVVVGDLVLADQVAKARATGRTWT
jgi:hypothetical protein